MPQAAPLSRLVSMNKAEWKYAVMGTLSSAILGLQMPGMFQLSDSEYS